MGCRFETRPPMYHPEFDDYDQELREFADSVSDRYEQSLRSGGMSDEYEEAGSERKTLPDRLHGNILEWLKSEEPSAEEGFDLAVQAFEQAVEHVVTYPPKGRIKTTRRIVWRRLLIDGRALEWLRRHRTDLFALTEREKDVRYLRALLR